MYSREEKINELLLDNRFVDWVINPQSPYAEYWLQWVNLNPHNTELAKEARIFLLELRKAESGSGLELNEAITVEMLAHIKQAIEAEDTVKERIRRSPLRWWHWAAAAIVVTGMIAGFAF